MGGNRTVAQVYERTSREWWRLWRPPRRGDGERADRSLRACRRHTRRVRRSPVLVVVAAAVVAVGCSPPEQATDTTSTTTADTAAPAAYYEATIRRTTAGVPHIVAADLKGVFFGQGFASAEDHGCSLSDQLLRIAGRRSEFFGAGDDDGNLRSDIAWKVIGIDALARTDYATVDPLLAEQFEAFAAGWNKYLARQGEFSGWCAGADWVVPVTGEDIYAYARSVALSASSAQLVPYLSSAQPPEPTAAPASSEDSTAAALDAAAASIAELPLASNAWAIGSERTTGGAGGVLLANPHFPWEGELRFWEVHLTVPGELDIYGAQLLGLPGVGIGFTRGFAWSHTVSAGNRFTAYSLQLDPTDPTKYLVDGEPQPMTPQEVVVRVRRDDGTMEEVTRTMWRSEYGPILDFPGVGWTASTVLTYRDANIDNDEFLDQYAAMNRAATLDEFIAAHRDHQGVPLFNTIAVSADGRAWYADTSATPKLSAEAEAAYLTSLEQGGLAAIAAQSRVVLLDGSNSLFRWEEVPGARDPGLVPWDDLPKTERRDYVFNANDSYWLSNADALLEGDYSVLHGRARVEQSWRTRENATVLSDTSSTGPAGADGTFTGEEIRDLAFANVGFVARALREPVVERCLDADFVRVPQLVGDDGAELLPAESVNVEFACRVLDEWDGRYDLDSRGAVLWREFVGRSDLSGLWATPFDPTDPVGTPSGLAEFVPDPAAEDDLLTRDPVLVGLARAVQVLTLAGLSVDAPLGETQFSERSGQRIPLHGGFGSDGVTNVLSWSGANNTTEELPTRGPRVISGSSLTLAGYPVNYGTSFIMVVDFSSGEPRAWTLLVYGQVGDRSSPLFDEQMLRYRDKNWKEAAFDEQQIASDPFFEERTISGDRED